jgi:hypothetical protein
MASSSNETVAAPATNPLTPFVTTSVLPATAVVTTGRPQSIASMMVSGRPSKRDGSTNKWFVAQIPQMSETCPWKETFFRRRKFARAFTDCSEGPVP